MAEKLDGNKIAMLTGIAIQDDETFKSEGGFIPERPILFSDATRRQCLFWLV